MSSKTRTAGRQAPLRVAIIITAAMLAASCKQETPPAAGADPAAPVEQAAPVEAVSEAVAAMSPEQLREAASKAYQESRLSAPGGDNAMEYYLALRDKQPADAGVSSALIDLLPMTVIATEQSRDREERCKTEEDSAGHGWSAENTEGRLTRGPLCWERL
jgi:periplasmic protein TonB